jgi:hypothetical protein
VTGVKKQRYQAPVSVARTRQLKRWDISDKVSASVFYCNDSPMVDLINNNKPTAALSITTDQFMTLNAVKDTVGNGNFEYDLGADVFLKRDVFKNKWYVSVRQYFKDVQGLVRPGKQGITMDADTWEGFVAVMHELGEFDSCVMCVCECMCECV